MVDRSRASSLIRLAALAALAGVSVLLPWQAARAAVIPCTAGNVTCLIDAITTANSTPGVADTIQLDGSTFTLSVVNNSTNGPNGLPSITSDITIEGNGSIIERSAAGGTPPFRLFHVPDTGKLTLNNVTVRNGLLPDDDGLGSWGAGIFNFGELWVTNSVITNNRAGNDSNDGGLAGSGGGILNGGTAHVTGSVVSHNTAGSTTGGLGTCCEPPTPTPAEAGYGGGIFNNRFILIGPEGISLSPGILHVATTTIANNRSGDANTTGDGGKGGDGAGIYTDGAVTTISRSTFHDNLAGKGSNAGDGGGLGIGGFGDVQVSNSTFYNNRAGGSIGDGTTVAGFGGGVHVEGPGAIVSINASTFFANQAGVVFNGQIDFNGKGGAIAVLHGNAEFPNSVTVKNTIFSENIAFSIPDFKPIFEDCFSLVPADFIDGGYNIDWRNSCGFSAANNSMIDTDPRLVLAPPFLVDNDGPTKTIALCTAVDVPHAECSGPSPALDAIPSGTNGCGTDPLDKDQRGFTRPTDGDGDTTARCDIGAFEVQAPPPTAVCGNGVVEAGEACDGGPCCSATCSFQPPTTACRPALGSCDLAEMCSGSSALCPADLFKPNGTTCSDGKACTIDDVCTAGVCAGTQVTCLGQNATICGDHRNNVLLGTSGPDVIHGLGGHDIIFGLGGHDLICGGDGNDIIFGDAGNDRIDGGSGIDICVGGLGADALTNCEVNVP
jgi:hypothetical protein